MNEKSCEHCKFYGIMLNSNKTIVTVCRLKPPIPYAVFVQTQMGPQWLSTNAYPVVGKEDWCGQYEPKVMMAN